MFLYKPYSSLPYSTPLLLPVPNASDLRLPHLALQLEDAVHEGLAGGGAPGDVDVDGDDAVAAPDDAVAVVVVAAAVGAAAHADDPARLGHLVVDLAQGRGHLVGQGPGHDHHVGLARRRPEDDPQPVLVVPRRREVHHLHGAARQPERHRPQRRLPRPVRHLVQRRQRVLDRPLRGLLARERYLPSWPPGGQAGGGGLRCHRGGIFLRGRRDGGGGLEGYD